MRCPKCQSNDLKVIDSRPSKDTASIRRRRECSACTFRFTTVETILKTNPLYVIKRDGRKEVFSSEKILSSLEKAFDKTSTTTENILAIQQAIVRRLEMDFDEAIPVDAIGEAIMAELKLTDEIACVRFASVYKDFSNLAELTNEIESLCSPSSP